MPSPLLRITAPPQPNQHFHNLPSTLPSSHRPAVIISKTASHRALTAVKPLVSVSKRNHIQRNKPSIRPRGSLRGKADRPPAIGSAASWPLPFMSGSMRSHLLARYICPAFEVAIMPGTRSWETISSTLDVTFLASGPMIFPAES